MKCCGGGTYGSIYPLLRKDFVMHKLHLSGLPCMICCLVLPVMKTFHHTSYSTKYIFKISL